MRNACECFVKHGYVILDHILPAEKVDALHREFGQTHGRCLLERQGDDSRQVGRRRFLVPVALSGGFGDPLVYANPCVLAVVRTVLDQDALLESFGAIVSLGGADVQRLHPDGPPLFNAAISALLPAYALTFALPLIEMNDRNGTIGLIPGSHRWQESRDDAVEERPVIPVGSGLLWDFRLHHRGMPNLSAHARPMLYATYARDWYQDPINFRQPGQRRLMYEPEFLDGVPPAARSLFASLRS